MTERSDVLQVRVTINAYIASEKANAVCPESDRPGTIPLLFTTAEYTSSVIISTLIFVLVDLQVGPTKHD